MEAGLTELTWCMVTTDREKFKGGPHLVRFTRGFPSV